MWIKSTWKRKTHQNEADESWSKWHWNASSGCNGLQQSHQISQSEIVCGKTKSNYTNSSDEYASLMISFVSESIV